MVSACMPPTLEGAGIAAKELAPIVLVASLWGPLWEGKHMCFYCDNEAVVAVIQQRRSKYTTLSQLLRCLFLYVPVFRVQFSSTHIPGINNVVGQMPISRNNLTLLSSLFPQATRMRVPPAMADFRLCSPDWGSHTWKDKFSHSLSLASHHQP